MRCGVWPEWTQKSSLGASLSLCETVFCQVYVSELSIHILFFIQPHFATFLVFGVVLFGVVLGCVVYAWLRGVEHN
jgi:hypothetical protein